MALVTKARAQEIVRRHVRADGGGFQRISADIQDLLETVEKLTGALEEALEGWRNWAREDCFIPGHPVYQRNRALLDGLKGAVPVPSYHPVAVCLECGWEHHFRRVIGVNEALVASALVEEAQAIHGGLCRRMQVELRPEDVVEASDAKYWFVAHCVCGWKHRFPETEDADLWARRVEYVELAKAEHCCNGRKEIGLQMFGRRQGQLSVSSSVVEE